MIPKVHRRGSRVGGLLRYLYGPGRHEEHTDPHLVAAWNGAGALSTLEPDVTARGRRDFRRLTELLEIPVRAGRNPPKQPVWHCSVRTHPDDPTLTDDQWRHIATEVMARAGLAPAGDERAVRWVAVRHADDHIHIVATLVRQDRRTCWPRNDYPLTQAACRDLEAEYGLYRVGQPGQGSRTWPTSNELNKATRRRRTLAPREELRRRVRAAATIAVDEEDFFARLTHDGTVTVRLRHSTRDPHQVTGYAVGLAGDTTATGELILHSGSKLAADLSLTRLRARWNPDTTLAGSDRRAHQLRPSTADLYRRAAHLIEAARHYVASAPGDPATAATVTAAIDLLTAVAGHDHAAGEALTRAAEMLDRAAHESTGHHPGRTGSAAYRLRGVARLLATLGNPRGQDDLQAMLQLIAAMAGLADAFADLRTARNRFDQADTAWAAAALLRGYTPALDTALNPPPPATPLRPQAATIQVPRAGHHR